MVATDGEPVRSHKEEQRRPTRPPPLSNLLGIPMNMPPSLFADFLTSGCKYFGILLCDLGFDSCFGLFLDRGYKRVCFFLLEQTGSIFFCSSGGSLAFLEYCHNSRKGPFPPPFGFSRVAKGGERREGSSPPPPTASRAESLSLSQLKTPPPSLLPKCQSVKKKCQSDKFQKKVSKAQLVCSRGMKADRP